ncbi:MAG: DUF3520 domain-containing protein [Pirellulaceae bacterium]|nr:DUF3520 domain-containing protein [Pirellulaceae bacterium]
MKDRPWCLSIQFRGGFEQCSLAQTAAVASSGMLLRDSQHKGTAMYDAVLEIAAAAKGTDRRLVGERVAATER